jgi:hypothetical protein
VLLDALWRCIAQGAGVYLRTRDTLLDALLRRRDRHGRPLPLHCISLHDTMAALCRPDGAITALRPPAERLPALVSLGNRGDARGEPFHRPDGTIALYDQQTMTPSALRRLAAALRVAAGRAGPGAGRHVALNRVYRGAEETIAAGARMRAAVGENGVVGACMAEFAREALLDPAALQALRLPGTDWPAQQPEHVARMARLLKAAYNQLRGQR